MTNRISAFLRCKLRASLTVYRIRLVSFLAYASHCIKFCLSYTLTYASEWYVLRRGSRSWRSMVICEPKGGCEQICASESERAEWQDEVTRTPAGTYPSELY